MQLEQYYNKFWEMWHAFFPYDIFFYVLLHSPIIEWKLISPVVKYAKHYNYGIF
jgi:hypothetical protein